MLAETLASEKLGLLRAKGFAKSSDGQVYAIQVVGRRWSVAAADFDIRPGIVMIAARGRFDDSLMDELTG